MHPILQQKLKRVARRGRSLRLWSLLAACWAGTAFLGLGLALFQKKTGLVLPWVPPALLTLAAASAGYVVWRLRQIPDLRPVAREIERNNPALDGRLLTALQQVEGPDGEYGFLQRRLLRETLNHDDVTDWSSSVPRSRVMVAQLAHWLAVALLGISLWALPTSSGKRPGLPSEYPLTGVNVSPGDTELERGTSLVVLARFGGPLPPDVTLVVSGSTGLVQRVPLVKSLSDPMFGGSVPEVTSDLLYRVEYDGTATRDFKVRVFEHPRLERADASLVFPAYTGLEPSRIENTRRLTAVEGTVLDLALHLNKPVAAASLVPKAKARQTVTLVCASNTASASLEGFALAANEEFSLVLVDTEGRTNKVASQFVFAVTTNRVPELRLVSPRGDLRPSPLEEIHFEATVWDDFGVDAFGLGFVRPGSEPTFIEMGRAVPRGEKRSFQHLLQLEELQMQPDQLISWFAWADDVGPDGNLRRNTTDLFFGEIRPFDEIFREGQSMDGASGGEQAGGGQGGQQSPGARLAELQKQIITATWKVQRDRGGIQKKPNQPDVPDQSAVGAEEARPLPWRGSSLRADQEVAETWPSGVDESGTRSPGIVFGLPAEQRPPRGRPNQDRGSARQGTVAVQPDADVLLESQETALDQAREAAQSQDDPRMAALWRAAIEDMEKALAGLRAAKGSSGSYAEALAAQQAAYQTLLKLQEHEFQVTRSRQQSGSQGGGQQNRMQRQLEQMELTQSENRYETQRQAQRPQTQERQEQLQVLSRLQELARRQQDVNERLKELQSALQEARTEQQREELRRQLKRLQEEEQQMLADLDELRQRMDQPQNQSSMAEQRRQLEETRQEIQRAAEAAERGSPSQALAAGTRAQDQLQNMRDQVRNQNAGEFSQDLRELRNQARELAETQQQIVQQMRERPAGERKSLSEPSAQAGLVEELARQRERMSNIVEQATEISRESEASEPLLSRQLHDTLRRFAQDTSRDVKDLQEQLLARGMMTRSLMDKLRDQKTPEASKLLETTAEMLRLDFMAPARDSAGRAAADFDTLRQGVERAAESVLGNDTEALRIAQDELDRLSRQLENEIAGARAGAETNLAANASQRAGSNGTNAPSQARLDGSTNLLSELNRPSTAGTNGPGAQATPGTRESQAGRQNPGELARSEAANGQRPDGGEQSGGQANERGQAGREPGSQPGQGDRRGAANPEETQLARNQESNRGGGGGQVNRTGRRTGGAEGADISGSLQEAFDALFDEAPGTQSGPITGDAYTAWSDSLRNVEEMVDNPELRNELTRVRDRVRQMRQDFRRVGQKPDWAVVRLQVVNPMVEVRNQIAEELARRDSREALVPIDRDPVPARYSELVRQYYEQLGRQEPSQ